MNIKHNRDNAIAIGLKLFYQKGFKSVGVDELCVVTGMAKGAFYHAFGRKEHFFHLTIKKYIEINNERILNILGLDNSLNGFEKIANFYLTMIEIQAKNNYHGCFINNTMTEISVNDLMAADICNQGVEAIVALITPVITSAQNEGFIKKDLPAKTIATLLHVTFYGILTLLKSSKNTTTASELMSHQLAQFKQ